MKKIYSSFQLGDMWAIYLLDTETKQCGLALLPDGLQEQFTLEGNWNIEPVVQLKLIGDPYPDGFSHGHSMKNSTTVRNLEFASQHTEQGTQLQIITTLRSEKVEVKHILEYTPNSLHMTMYSQVTNTTRQTVELELFTSYNLCAFSSLCNELRMEDFVLHRMQSKWSMEGKLESTPFLDLQLEPAWLCIGSNSVRFGQIGSMPVRKYFPWMIAEDTRFGYGIGIQLAHPASWQMEVYNKDERIALSGGLADREYGHWTKKLASAEAFESPKAYVTVAKEDVDGISYRLTSAQWANLERVPESEKDLPIIFNDYCTTWGNPTEENMLRIIEVLQGKGIRYCVIDAGWYIPEGKDWSAIGDWLPNNQRFPHGLKYIADKIREAGMLPGIWYEMEVIGASSEIYEKEEFQLHRDGYPIQTCERRFLDLRKEEVQTYLEERVIGQLRDCGFSYLKVDYNDNIGVGCDGAESLGEGLRQNMMASRKFWRKMHEQLPELVIENCSSGGHRLEPSMQALASMASFSDAHECQAIPVIAANVTRAILPAQSQIWAVLRKGDDEKRLYYSLSNTFLGRMCLSGDVYDLESWQWQIIESGMQFYKKCAPIIKSGRNYRQGPHMNSYNHLKGWQAVCRKDSDAKQWLVVVHGFDGVEDTLQVVLPQDEKVEWKLAGQFHREGILAQVNGKVLQLSGLEAYDGAVFLLEKGQGL